MAARQCPRGSELREDRGTLFTVIIPFSFERGFIMDFIMHLYLVSIPDVHLCLLVLTESGPDN